jgi:hypothetical protein
MLINLHIAQIVIVLASVGAVLCAVPEGRQRVTRPWMLLLPAGLAAIAAFVQIIYPSLKELDQPAMWELAVIAGVIGLVRGQFMPLEVDQIWHRVRTRRAPEGLLAAIAILLLALLGALEASLVGLNRDPENPGIRLLIEIGMAAGAGFLIGRAGAAWFRISHTPHQDLVDEQPDA